jgi:hypothetical protein
MLDLPSRQEIERELQYRADHKAESFYPDRNQIETNTAIEASDTVESPFDEAGSSSDVLHDLPDSRI